MFGEARWAVLGWAGGAGRTGLGGLDWAVWAGLSALGWAGLAVLTGLGGRHFQGQNAPLFPISVRLLRRDEVLRLPPVQVLQRHQQTGEGGEWAGWVRRGGEWAGWVRRAGQGGAGAMA